jgi:hypothetical protein
MTRDLAKIKTIEKFTNLLDGSLLPGYSVAQVISYYDSQILGIPTDNPRRIDGIIANFMEDYVNGLANEQEEL